MTNEQPEALRLAELLEKAPAHTLEDGTITLYLGGTVVADRAAAMLRKLYVHNTELENSLIQKSIAIQKIWKERDDLRKRQAADEALLRQALEALEGLFGVPDQWTGAGAGGVAVWRIGGPEPVRVVIAAIKERLK